MRKIKSSGTSKKGILTAITFVLLLTACGRSEQPTPSSLRASPASSKETPAVITLLPEQHYGDKLQMQDKRQKLYHFITTELSGTAGIYTNLQDTEQTAELTTGHEMLSESAGLMMRYKALTQQKSAFEAEWTLAKQTFNMEAAFSYRFSPKLQKRYTLNAAVDDLRIIRALYEASDVFQSEAYMQEADSFGKRFYEHNVKNGYLYDFYDETYKITNDFITLCYIDLKTLGLLPIEAGERQTLIASMEKIIKDGYLSDEFPFYETRYDYGAGKYSSDHINMVESLLTVLALAEMGEEKAESIRYIKERVKAGTLYGQYTREGAATTDTRSTAIYAITAMIGSVIGDQTLYADSIGKMNEFQIEEVGSSLLGGFGDTAAQQAYSFDNLMALLAYTY
ncbi:Glycosyl hydrolases family 8 [Paenibacillus algorifonticola]|uniref:Glycosyl hydrolases family 8 n=1 Tax=Paenibacillus algorifonticola TaxID=684063 RepID=A0A1I2F5A0_9BACL|nr:hypothetical protein [Paenibacillus algorifonticola]SFF00345.1 Glycosyl hydrolases family 8 [Paenibacillus algorifonticola]